jgi:hypothetical protein
MKAMSKITTVKTPLMNAFFHFLKVKILDLQQKSIFIAARSIPPFNIYQPSNRIRPISLYLIHENYHL